MSKGPGKWERLILAALREYPAFFVRDLLPRRASRAQRSALYRAMRTLEIAGRIGALRRGFRLGDMNLTAAITRPGATMSFEEIPRLNVDAVPNGYRVNT